MGEEEASLEEWVWKFHSQVQAKMETLRAIPEQFRELQGAGQGQVRAIGHLEELKRL